MKSNPDFTAYALGELSKEEEKKLLEQLKTQGFSDENISKEIEEIQNMSNKLGNEFRKDDRLRLAVEQRENILNQQPNKKINWLNWTSSIVGLSVAGIAGLMLFFQEPSQILTKKVFTKANKIATDNSDTVFQDSNFEPNIASFEPVSSVQVPPQPPQNKRQMEFGFKHKMTASRSREGGSSDTSYSRGNITNDQKEFNREAYAKIDTNPYTLVENQPLSTFSVDVDTASYANIRRFLFKGSLPPKDSLRVEELINYFHYDYKVNFNKHPLGILVDQSISPWHKNRKLVRVALKSTTPEDLLTKKKNLVFLLDVSGSMSSPEKLPLLKDSIKLLMRKLKKEDVISIVTYAGHNRIVLDGIEAKNKLKIFQALDHLNSGGGTNGGNGIIAAYKLAKQNFIKNGVNRIILATDGDFNLGTTSESSLIDMVEEKAKQDIFLTVVGLGMGNYQDSMLEKISNRGNGNYAYIDSMNEANKLFNIDLEKNLTTVAKDVKIQIEFNPKKVQAYRLIGYENRMLKAQDFNDDKKDAGEMGAGHTVTALYEIVLPSEKFEGAKTDKLKYQNSNKTEATISSDELLTVKVRYKNPTEDKSTKFDIPLMDKNNDFEQMDLDFKFATAVASFGMKVRNDEMVKDLRYRDIENMAKKSKGSDIFGFREEFLELIDFTKQIDK